MRSFVVNRFGAAAVLVSLFTLFGVSVLAQQADQEPAEGDESIEEIIVVEPKPGARRRIDQEYEDPTRARIRKDLSEMKADQEEYEWRKAAAAEDQSRIKWGYDPSDEYQMRNEMALQDLNWDHTKPATLFRLGF